MAENQTRITANMNGLNTMIAKLGERRARVGVLGSHAARTEPGAKLNNAELAAIQIFGSITANIPPRDFLLTPIETHGKEIAKAVGSKAMTGAIAAGDVDKAYELLGAAAEAIVQEGFASAGFGLWPANAPSTIAQKGSDAPLINEGELRHSVISDVVKKSDIV